MLLSGLLNIRNLILKYIVPLAICQIYIFKYNCAIWFNIRNLKGFILLLKYDNFVLFPPLDVAGDYSIYFT